MRMAKEKVVFQNKQNKKRVNTHAFYFAVAQLLVVISACVAK